MLKLVINRLHKRYSPRGAAASAAEGLDLDLEEEVGARLNAERIRQCDVDGREVSYKLLVKCSYVDNRYRSDLKAEDVECAKEQLLDEIETVARSGK